MNLLPNVFRPILGTLACLAATLQAAAPAGRTAAMTTPTGLLFHDSTQSFAGYTLFGTRGRTYLLDMQGRIAHQWTGCGTNPRLLNNGHLLDAIDQGRTFVELDWDGKTIWKYSESRSAYSPHHDWTRIYNAKLADSTTLYIANKSLDAATVLALGADSANGPYAGSQIDAITEVDRSGNIVWEWSFADHLVQDIDSTRANWAGSGKTVASHPERLDANLPGRPIRRDWLHCNSLDYQPSTGRIVINSVQGEFYVIDHDGTFLAGDPTGSIAKAATTAGDFIYRFGDPARYGQGDPPSLAEDWTRSSTGDKQIGGSHDIQWIQDGLEGAGHFLVFNNGQYLYEATSQSYIVEIDPFLKADSTRAGSYVNPPDAGYVVVSPTNPDLMKQKKNISRQVTWSYGASSSVSFFSQIGSSAQRLPNGNTLICAMTQGDLFEVTASGDLVWEYVIPVTPDGIETILVDPVPNRNAAFRAYRYPSTHPALVGRDLTATQLLTSLGVASRVTPSNAGILHDRTSGTLRFSPTATSPFEVRVTDLRGRTWMHQASLGDAITWSTASLPSGLFLATLSQDGRTRTLRLAKP